MKHTPVPTYDVSTRITGAITDSHHQTDLEDPFVNTTTSVVLGFWRSVSELVRRRKITVTVNHVVSGNRDALLHVMNVRPVDVVDGPRVPTEGAHA